MTAPTAAETAAAEAAAAAAAEAAAAAGEGEAAAGVRAGDVVYYEHPDPITGDTLRGAGVVLWVPDSGALNISPCSASVLQVEPGNVTAIPAEAWLADDEDGSAG